MPRVKERVMAAVSCCAGAVGFKMWLAYHGASKRAIGLQYSQALTNSRLAEAAQKVEASAIDRSGEHLAALTTCSRAVSDVY